MQWNYAKALGIIAFLTCLSLGMSAYVKGFVKVEPDNPLKEACSSSHQLVYGKETIQLPDEMLELAFENGNRNHQNAKKEKESSDAKDRNKELSKSDAGDKGISTNQVEGVSGNVPGISQTSGGEVTEVGDDKSEEASPKKPSVSDNSESGPGPDLELLITTDLKDETVQEENLSFHAGYTGITQAAKFSVTCNGKALTGTGGNYQTALSMGPEGNLIRLKVTDRVKGQVKTLTQEYQIHYVPVTTPETAPRLTYINLTENQILNVPEFTLVLSAEDYQGNKIGYEGVTVQVNGVPYVFVGDGSHLEYDTLLTEGDNLFTIRLTDKWGRYADFQYHAVYEVKKEIHVTFRIEASTLGLGTIVSDQSILVDAGKNAAYALEQFLSQNNIEFEYGGSFEEGFYLARIKKEGIGSGASVPEELEELVSAEYNWNGEGKDDSIGEYDYSDKSGFMYSVNGNTPNRSFSKCMLQEGDFVRVRFTLANGKDIGAGPNGENYDGEW